MKKRYIIVLIVSLIVILLAVGVISFIGFHKGEAANSTMVEDDIEETVDNYGVSGETYTDPEDVIDVIMNDYLSGDDTVTLEKTEGDCWFFVDNYSHHYKYCQSDSVVTIVP